MESVGMANGRKQISNPASTGNAGGLFEAQVQAYFVALMLSGGVCPCLRPPCRPIQKIKLQGRRAHFEIDDAIVFTGNPNGTDEQRLLCQMKRTVSSTRGDAEFGEVIRAAWSDFTNPQVFTRDKDAIALITGPLSATDCDHTRTILEWARDRESAEEFFTDVNMGRFSSLEKQQKCEAFRCHVNACVQNPVSDVEFVSFLRHFHILGFDFDFYSGLMHSVMHSVIGHYSPHNARGVWAQIVQEVQYSNSTGGTLTRESLPTDILEVFTKPAAEVMPASLAFNIAPKVAVAWTDPQYASALVVANLLGAWDERSEADKAIAARMAQGQYDSWFGLIREVLQLSESPLSYRNGTWSVKNRGDLWAALGSRVFDDHLTELRRCAERVLTERDPKFELDFEQRFAASIHGKMLKHSPELRKGLSETLALLESRPEPLTNCSQQAAESTPRVAVRNILNASDWVLWASLNDLLPFLAEAAPNEFLSAVEKALGASPCPFDQLFSQEGQGIMGTTYMSGLLWALETLAWDEQFLVRTTLALGALAERDPGGQWTNRPSNSLTTIFLPWLPQTTASVEKRSVAIESLLHERPDVGWKLLMTFLPGESEVSSGSRKPKWRRSIHPDWKDRPTAQDYWKQVHIYSDMAVNIAIEHVARLTQLVPLVDHLPKPAFQRVLKHVSSNAIKNIAESDRHGIWSALMAVARKHSKFADAEWALPVKAVERIKEAAQAIAPQDPRYLFRGLFSGRDWDQFDDRRNWREQEKELESQRKSAIMQILNVGGLSAVLEFAKGAGSSWHVGRSVGALAEYDAAEDIVPHLLEVEEEPICQFVIGFIWGRFDRGGWAWVDSIQMESEKWSSGMIGKFFAYLPFSSETWTRVDRILGSDSGEYWKRVAINPYQAEGDLYIAVNRLLDHHRGRAAVDCLSKLIDDGVPLDRQTAIRALFAAITSSDRADSLHSHHVTTVIQKLQNDPEVDRSTLLQIELAYLPVLSDRNNAAPVTWENELATNPCAFCDLIQLIFRSTNREKSEVEITKEQEAVARRAYELLEEWTTPPGTVSGDGCDGEALKQWIDAVKQSTEASGHLVVAFLKAGGVFIHSPPDPDGLWIHRDVAGVLDRPDMNDLRRGYSIAIHNSRGAHFVDPSGADERELANKYRRQAEDVENAGFPRFATTLKEVAEQYDYEAKRVVEDHQRDIDADD